MTKFKVGDFVSWSERKLDRDVIVRIEENEAYFSDGGWCELSELTLVEDGLSATNTVTLRDYFAAKAMQGELSKSDGYEMPNNIAEYAYKIADAMIAKRNGG